MNGPIVEAFPPVPFLSDRLIGAMMVAAVSWLPEFDHDAETLTLWHSLRLANIAGLVGSAPATTRGEISKGALPPLSANALAESLGVTASTIQGRLKRLIERGWIEKGRSGLMATVPAASAAAVDTLFDVAVTVFGDLILQIATERRLEAASATRYPVGALEAEAASLPRDRSLLLEYHYIGYILRVMDAARATFECDSLDPIIFGTLAGLNPSAPSSSSALLSVRGLADLVEQPPETVRRRVRGLEERGMVEDLRPGLTIPQGTLNSDRVIAHARTVIQYFYQMQAAIARSRGLPASASRPPATGGRVTASA